MRPKTKMTFTERNGVRRSSKGPLRSRARWLYNQARLLRRQYPDGAFGQHPNDYVYNELVTGTTGSFREGDEAQ